MHADDSSVLDQYLEYLEVTKGRSPATVSGYQAHLKCLATYLEDSGKRLVAATAEDLEAFTGLHLHKRGVSARSRRPAIAAVRGFYAWLFRGGLTRTNLAQHLAYPAMGRKLPDAMPLKAVEAMLLQTDLDTFRGVRDAAIISLLAGCGLRVSGLVALNERSLSTEVDGKGGEVQLVRVTEKGGSDRIVPVPLEAWTMVRAYLGHPDLDKIDRSLPNGDKVLFCNTRHPRKRDFDNCGESRRLSVWGVRRLVMKYGHLANVPEQYCHPHALRHLYATELVESDTNLAVVQQLMGHKSIESSKVYIHLAVRRLRDAVDQGNPLAKIQTPTSGIAAFLRRSQP